MLRRSQRPTGRRFPVLPLPRGQRGLLLVSTMFESSKSDRVVGGLL